MLNKEECLKKMKEETVSMEPKYKCLADEYVNARTKYFFKCSHGHIFDMSWYKFKQGQRCPKERYERSSNTLRLDIKDIKEYYKDRKYEFLSDEYIGSKIKYPIKCPNGHIFYMNVSNFKQGQRCPHERYERSRETQTNSLKLIQEEVKELEPGYKFIDNEYINVKTKHKFRCSNGHVFEISLDAFRRNQRCNKCSKSFSKPEEEIGEYIKSLGINIVIKDRNIIKPLELDIVIPEKKLAIEHCGLYWHSEAEKDKNYHKNKLKLTNEEGYRLITIFGDEWLHKKDIVKNRLKYILGLEENKIYARKCNIREISMEEAKRFIDEYHIQGFANASVYIGAFYKDGLVAVNTFVKRGLSHELNRFCVSKNVIGIASKLLKYFQRNYEWEEIYTFADLRWSSGNLYEKIGFVKDKELKPDYSYFDNSNNKNIRYHKFNFRHKQMKYKLKNYNSELSERENMKNNGWLRIYDCGKIRYSIKR